MFNCCSIFSNNPQTLLTDFILHSENLVEVYVHYLKLENTYKWPTFILIKTADIVLCDT